MQYFVQKLDAPTRYKENGDTCENDGRCVPGYRNCWKFWQEVNHKENEARLDIELLSLESDPFKRCLFEANFLNPLAIMSKTWSPHQYRGSVGKLKDLHRIPKIEQKSFVTLIRAGVAAPVQQM